MDRILVLDNYDSFTYNLVHAIVNIVGHQIDVVRNDEITPEEAAVYDKIVLSPGPGVPDEAGILKELIRKLGPDKNIFGVCLGLQAIAEVYGGKLINLNKVYHGVATQMYVKQKDEILFRGLPSEFEAGRYHSWLVSNDDLPDCLDITCIDEDDQIMALRHKVYNVSGVQFHPESVLTPVGNRIIENWLKH